MTEKIGLVTSKSIQKCTGKNWNQWIATLNTAGAQHWNHKEIVAFLKKKYKLSIWWQQGVTGGYEIALGRRVSGQNLKGQFSTTSVKTFSMDAKAAWKLITSKTGLSIWLKPLSDFQVKAKNTFECEGEVFGEVRTMKAGHRIRMSWQETEWDKPSIVQVFVIPRPKGKCMLVISHGELKTGRLRLKMKDHWKQVLEELDQHTAFGNTRDRR